MRRLALLGGGFSLGIFLAQYLLPPAFWLPGAGLCLTLTALAVFLLRRTDLPRRRALLLGCALAAGLGYNALYTQLVLSPAELLADTEREAVTMTLCEYPEATSYGAQVTVRLNGLTPGKAVYYGSEALLGLEPGNTVTCDVSFGSARTVRGEEIRSFTSKGVFLLCYRRGEETVETGSAGSLRWLPQRTARAMAERIDEIFSQDSAPFLTAILTGDRSGIPQKAGDDLSEVGLYHLLAISGMHCAYLMELLYLVLGRHRRRLTAFLGLPLLLFYALLSGASPSVLRACVMLSFLLFAPLFGRERDSLTAIFAALLLILLANPFAAASVSLQLSFAAIGGILWVTPKLSDWLGKGRDLGAAGRFVTGSVSVSLGAMVFTTPLCAVYFNSLTLISPVSNLLCLWCVGLIFCGGLLAVALSFLWLPLGPVLAFVPGLLVRYLLWMAGLLARIPYHALYFSNPYLKYWLGLLYLLFGIAWLSREKGKRKWLLSAGLSAVCLLYAVYLGSLRYAYGSLNAEVLDVGQGQSVILSSQGDFALTDCGSLNRWKDAGGIAAEALQSAGCRQLRYLLLTHYDYDHVSGVQGLLVRVGAETLLCPPDGGDTDAQAAILAAAEAHGTEVRFITEETTLPLGEATLTVYPPLGDDSSNERGLVYLVSAGDYDLLITGDIDAEMERRLIERYDLPDIEALVVGHHGSKYSTSSELLDALRPETAFISVGSNSYGHPSDQAMERLAERDITIYRTDLQGDLRLSVH